jgi:hypothetical protein
MLLAMLLVALVLGVGCNGDPSENYALTGSEWESVDPLYYYRDHGASSGTRSAWLNAATYWNSTDTPVNFVSSVDDYVVYLSEFYRDDDEWWRTTDGLTLLMSDSENRIVWAIGYLNTFLTQYYSAGARRSVAGHELGHVLGLDEFDGEVLMQQDTWIRFFVNGIYGPQQGDIDGVNAMYG